MKDYARQQATLNVVHAVMECDLAALLGLNPTGDRWKEDFSETKATILQKGDECSTKAGKGTCVKASYIVRDMTENASILESCENFAFDIDDGGAFPPLNDTVQGLHRGAEFTVKYVALSLSCCHSCS